MSRREDSAWVDSFNAKYLGPADVARSFVAPRQYASLLKSQSTVVIGPRGSGKTTLLKMLQLPALEAYASEGATTIHKRVKYTGVFVGADRAWFEQLRLADGDVGDPGRLDLLGSCAFLTHVLRAFVEACLYRVHPPTDPELRPLLRVALSDAAEAELCRLLSVAWRLPDTPPTLSALHFALSVRLIALGEAAGKIRDGLSQRPDDIGSIAAFLHLPMVPSLVAGMDAFELAARVPRQTWALLFDELELAPRSVRETVIRSLRGVDERIILKLALSPFSEDPGIWREEVRGFASHDYEVVPLWSPRKEASYDFCRSLMTDILRQRSVPGDPGSLFGLSPFDSPSAMWRSSGTAYSSSSRVGQRVAALAAKDPSFADYLRGQHIDVNALEETGGKHRAETLRKVASVVVVREFFWGPERDRPRKNADIYSGERTIYAVSEGNPRRIKDLADRMLAQLEPGSDKVPPRVQSREIEAAAGRFHAYLQSLPLTQQAPHGGSARRGLVWLIETLGRAFENEVLGPQFNPEPAGSCAIGAGIGAELADAVGRAVNAGALVLLTGRDESDILPLTNLRGLRFRLSYLLATRYSLPLTLLRPVLLGGLLTKIRDSSQGDFPFREDVLHA